MRSGPRLRVVRAHGCAPWFVQRAIVAAVILAGHKSGIDTKVSSPIPLLLLLSSLLPRLFYRRQCGRSGRLRAKPRRTSRWHLAAHNSVVCFYSFTFFLSVWGFLSSGFHNLIRLSLYVRLLSNSTSLHVVLTASYIRVFITKQTDSVKIRSLGF